MNETANSKRIAKNTLILYIRMLLMTLVSLYTSRVILNILGIVDFGIYNVVGGLIAIFSMLSATFSSTTQRFLSYELGRNNKERLKDVFSISLNFHFILAAFIFILIEVVGLWFLNHKMNIPYERLSAAKWIFHFSMITFIFNLISIPYNASIIANEKMDIFAYIAILETLLRLIALFFLKILPFDKMIIYAFFIMFIAIIIRVIYGIYCSKHFEECRYRRVKDKLLYKEMLGLSGWNFLGSSASIFTIESINIILNIFGGVAVNAAKGISTQIQGVVTQLVNNFMISLNPQVVKSYALTDYEFLISLIDRGTRFSFYIMSLLVLPLILETHEFLALWLKSVPDYAVIFTRLTLIYLMLHPFSTLLDQVILASGSIKISQIVLSILQFLNFPVSFFILKLGYPFYCIFYSYIILAIISLLIRLLFVHKYIFLSYRFYIQKVFLRSFLVFLVSLIIPFIIISNFSSDFIRFVIVILITIGSTISSVYIFGLNVNERYFFIKKKKEFLIKFKNIFRIP